jgi:hypothetical protein
LPPYTLITRLLQNPSPDRPRHHRRHRLPRFQVHKDPIHGEKRIRIRIKIKRVFSNGAVAEKRKARKINARKKRMLVFSVRCSARKRSQRRLLLQGSRMDNRDETQL